MRAPAWLICFGGLSLGCGHKPNAIAGTQVAMSFDRSRGFFSAPFPSDDLRRADGTIDISQFPNRDDVDLIAKGIDLIGRTAHGFAATAGVFFQLSAPADATRLPSLAQSVTEGATVFLADVDPASPDFLRRQPAEIAFTADGGPFGAPNLLSLLPLQGAPLRPLTRYAAVVLRGTLDAAGKPLGVSLEMAQLAAGDRPPSLGDEAFKRYRDALGALAKSGVSAQDIAGLAVFTTDDPTAQLGAFRDDVLARPHPALTQAFQRAEVFDDFCVYSSTIPMPDYQSGQPPFLSGGGGWALDAAGKPALQRTEEANIVVTVPRRAIPSAGFPLVVFIRAGGGGDRPLVDRGPQAMTGGPALVPGTGPALHFARAGFAGISVDGPLGGRRNTTQGEEEYLLFNALNPDALRDNIRESALETILLAHILDDLTVDASDCPGAVRADGTARVTFDTAQLALMGHSNGAWIAPLVLAFEPRFRAAILSGAGGSWIENVVYKKLPRDVRALAELLLGYVTTGRTLTTQDPVLAIVQWAQEAADPQVYGRRILREPRPGEPLRHVLMIQGIVDHYILPRIANSTSLAMGLDLAGNALDHDRPDYADQMSILQALPLMQEHQIALPASGNFGGAATAVVVQHLGDGIEDGHEVAFQTDPPKHQYRCFLQSLLAGTPSVPVDGDAAAPCP